MKPDQFQPRPPNADTDPDTNEDRRKFLAACEKFAAVTPPAIALLLSTSLNSTAIAHSGGRGDPARGHHKGHHHHGKSLFR
jgi:hypothetical protein